MPTGIPDRQEQYEAVRDADLANGLTWLPPAPANNTYAFAVRSEAVPELGGIDSLSDIAALPVEQRTFCVESEFATRSDGFEPMLEAYGIPLGDPQGVPRDNVNILDTGAVYTATDNGLCNFGEVFTTDGRIPALDLTVLEDDRAFFPAYNVAPVVLTETLEQHPGHRRGVRADHPAAHRRRAAAAQRAGGRRRRGPRRRGAGLAGVRGAGRPGLTARPASARLAGWTPRRSCSATCASGGPTCWPSSTAWASTTSGGR
jgi:hypothetical protein